MNAGRYGLISLAFAVLFLTTMQAVADPKPRGRIHLDYAFHDEDRQALPDGHRVRRAWMGITGSLDSDWSYILEADVAEGNVNLVDAYLRYSGLETGNLTVGHFKVPFGMDFITAADDLLFPERPLANAFVPGRRVGLGYSHDGGGLGFDAMLFGQGAGSHNARAAEGGDEGFGLAARLYGAIIENDNNLLHLAAAMTSEDAPSSENETVRYSSFPESRVTGVRLVDTGSIDQVDRINRLGLEAGYQRGPLVLQGEYLTVNTDRLGTAQDLDMSGYYGQASYVLNGGQRRYTGGTFRNPPVGSWELAFRYSYLDLNDGPVLGGDERNISVGANYYAGAGIRFMLSLINVDSEQDGQSDDPNILLFRTQVSF